MRKAVVSKAIPQFLGHDKYTMLGVENKMDVLFSCAVPKLAASQ